MTSPRYLWRALAYRWRRNRQELEQLARRIQVGDTVIDIGCHKGGFLFWLRRYVGSSGHVYAFEPQPSLAAYLEGIIAASGWRNVTLEAAALSSSSGSTTLNVPARQGASSPGATLSPTGAEGDHYTVPVRVLRLDGYLKDRDVRVACIKCDCEGHELEVFKGAERVLREDRPALLFECERRHIVNGTPRDVFEYLRERGYRGFFFSPSGLQPIEQFQPDVHQPIREGRFWQAPDYCNNFLFTPETEGP